MAQWLKMLADVADDELSSGPLFNSSSLMAMIPPQGDLSPLPAQNHTPPPTVPHVVNIIKNNKDT